MNSLTSKKKPVVLNALVIACLVILLSFLWQSHKGFSISDGGFLWYGVQRVLLGEVPIRDFMAYDPGRYYWGAILSRCMGHDGIIQLRAAMAIFQVLGLFAGLLLIARSGKGDANYGPGLLFISAVTLAVWMFPWQRLFDISVSIFLVGVLTFLINNPVPKRYFFSGVGVGLIAVCGRNHGVYGVMASLGVIAWLNMKSGVQSGFLKGILLWGVGVTTGFLPVIVMILFVPGFGAAFMESILFQWKVINLSLPVPWPWTVHFSTVSFSGAFRGILTGLFFMLLVLFGVTAPAWVIYKKIRKNPAPPPALVASSFLALPYAHYAFSRADTEHLALGIFPLIIGCLIIASNTQHQIKWPIIITLCGISFWIVHAFYPGWQCLAGPCVRVEVSGSTLQIDPGTAGTIALLRRLVRQYAPNGQPFIATPFCPGAYALLNRKSPMWEIYALFPSSERTQKKEIKRIKASRPRIAFISDEPLDGRNERRFKNTHPLVYQYILDHFNPLPGSKNRAFLVYKVKGAEQ